MKNIEEIAQVDGLDMLFVGPFDLAKSMDIKFGGDEHEEAIEKVRVTAKKNGKKSAIFCKSTSNSCDRSTAWADIRYVRSSGQEAVDAGL